MFVPDYVGKIVDAYTEENYEGKDGVYQRLKEWMLILCVGVACTFCQNFIFGLTGERLGNSLRGDLFNSIIKKDIAFFDSFRTGEILSRISSDTQIVQEGLSMAVAQVLTAIAKIVFIVVILFTYSWKITLCVMTCLLPSILATRWALTYMNKSAVASQSAKGKMSAMTEETISNIKTVKCFAEEQTHIDKF